MKNVRIFALLVITGSLFLWSAPTASAKVPTPQIYQVVTSPDNTYRPWVTGLTPNEVEVEILVDEVPQGLAKVVEDKSGTASFGWSPQQDLPVGFHQFRVRGKFGNEYSEPGGIIGYNVRRPTPIPILVEPEQYEEYVLIRGLIANDSSVRIYIDKALMADFTVPNHPSGTTNFWFRAKGLLNGIHEVYAVAVDETGKASKKSAPLTFKTEQQKLTKGEDMNSEAGSEVGKENTGQVIDAPAEGTVMIDDKPTTGDVMITDHEEPGSVQVRDQGSEPVDRSADGQVSSTATDETGSMAATTTALNKEKQNRVTGLVILGLIMIALLAWYWQEKKRVGAGDDSIESQE